MALRRVVSLVLIALVSGALALACDAPSGLGDVRGGRIEDGTGDTVIRGGRKLDPRVDITALEAHVEGQTLVATIVLRGDPNVWGPNQSDQPGYTISVVPDDKPLNQQYQLRVHQDRGAWRLGIAGPVGDVRYFDEGLEPVRIP